MNDFYRLHAEICKTIANPVRLAILDILQDKEMNATEILKKVKVSKANLSQHMNLLQQKGVIISRREGLHIYYKIGDKRILKATGIMKEVLKSWIKRNQSILTEAH
ncbi:MAG: winged helix-turn-helix transcriptional regulator [Spirochaetales bacterium]|nr:winged helix-turn-helix transcriptional regulator [Spirochaetales bacterium]